MGLSEEADADANTKQQTKARRASQGDVGLECFEAGVIGNMAMARAHAEKNTSVSNAREEDLCLKKEQETFQRGVTVGCSPLEATPNRRQEKSSDAKQQDANHRELGLVHTKTEEGTLEETNLKDGQDQPEPEASTDSQARGSTSDIQTISDAPLNRRPVSRPGAFPQAGWNQDHDSASNFTLNNTSEALRADSNNNSNHQPPSIQHSNSGLVQADPVTASRMFTLDDLEVAEPFEHADAEQNGKRNQEKKRTSVQMGLFGVAILLLVVIGLIVFFVIKARKDDGADSATLSTTPTTAMAPTFDPLLALLPTATQEIIQSDSNQTQAQTKAYHWLLQDPQLDTFSNERSIQRFAMVTFYYATNGPNWRHKGGDTALVTFPAPGYGAGAGGGSGGPSPNSSSVQSPPDNASRQPPPRPPKTKNVTKEEWLNYTTHECEWFATMDVCPTNNETVTDFDMVNNGLSGQLPAELGLLTELTWLSVFANQISGRLPTEIFQLTNLENFKLNANRFTGPIPAEIQRLTALEVFSPLDNGFTGTIPMELWSLSRLDRLRASRNLFTGSIPSDLCEKLPNVLILRVDRNQLSGSIASTFGRCTQLELLDLSDNRLTGSIPTELGLLTALSEISVNSNQLTGSLPSELALLTAAHRISLSDNAGLTGSVPSEWASLNDTLVHLYLEDTAISGVIPPDLCNVPTLDFQCAAATLCGCECECEAHNNTGSRMLGASADSATT